MNDFELAAIGPAFDRSYYLTRYPDVGAAGCDPLRHFCEAGWREGRHPSAAFDTGYYLRTNQDVQQSGINPLLHYVYSGKAEGRLAQPAMASVRARLAAARPARVAAKDWTAPAQAEPASAAHLLQACKRPERLVIAVSQDDYAVNVGGVQNVVGDESAALQARGFDYLHLSPAQPGPALAEATQLADVCFRVRLNGEQSGCITAPALRAMLQQLARRGAHPRWVIHHLMGHSPEALAELVAEARAQVPLLWAHDFFAVCPSYTLMRNDIAYCNAPPPTSPGCSICVYGTERHAHARRLRAFVEKVRPSVIAPSRSAAELWQRAVQASPCETIVLPPADLVVQARQRVPRPARPLRVAHVGARLFHKGWFVFQTLAETLRHDARYEFFQFGSMSGFELESVKHIPVRVTPTDRQAMVAALARHEIDVVVCWSLWPETFNFTLHEAVAAGAFVLARRNQGNVWPAASRWAPHASLAFEDEAGLLAYFRSDAVARDVDGSPRYCGQLVPNMGCADLLSAEASLEAVT